MRELHSYKCNTTQRNRTLCSTQFCWTEYLKRIHTGIHSRPTLPGSSRISFVEYDSCVYVRATASVLCIQMRVYLCVLAATYLYFYGHLSISWRHEANEYGNERTYCVFSINFGFFFMIFAFDFGVSACCLLIFLWYLEHYWLIHVELDQSLIKLWNKIERNRNRIKWSEVVRRQKNFSRIYTAIEVMINDHIRKLYNCVYMHWYTGNIAQIRICSACKSSMISIWFSVRYFVQRNRKRYV